MFVLCPGLCSPCDADGHCSGAAFMSRQWDQNVQCLFGGAGSLRQGEQPQVCRRGLQGLLSVLHWSGPVDCRAQNQDPGLGLEHRLYNLGWVCAPRRKTPTTQCAQYNCVCWASFGRLLFHASGIPVLYTFHSILHDLKFLFGHLLVFIMQSNIGWLYVSHH